MSNITVYEYKRLHFKDDIQDANRVFDFDINSVLVVDVTRGKTTVSLSGDAEQWCLGELGYLPQMGMFKHDHHRCYVFLYYAEFKSETDAILFKMKFQ